MSEIPDSIPNNFSLPPEQTSGVIPMESRAYHAYTEHPHAEPAIPVKTRGLEYIETTLGGKPFTIAQRLQSKSAQTADSSQSTEIDEPPVEDTPTDAETEAQESLLTDAQIADFKARYLAGRRATRQDIAAGHSPLSGNGHINLGSDDEAVFAQDADKFIKEHEALIARLYNRSQPISSASTEAPQDQVNDPNETDPTLDLGDSPPRPPRPPRRSHVEDWGFALTRDEVNSPLVSEELAYRPDREGNVFFTKEYFGVGDTIVWNELPETRRNDRRILITAENGDEYYVYNDRIFDLQRSHNNEIVFYPLQGRALPDITIGENWDLGRQGVTDNIDTVEVFTAKMPQAEARARNFFDAENAGNARNRFAELERMIRYSIPTHRHDPVSRPTRGERLREAGGRAWETANDQLWQILGRTVLAGIVSLDIDDVNEDASLSKRLRGRAMRQTAEALKAEAKDTLSAEDLEQDD